MAGGRAVETWPLLSSEIVKHSKQKHTHSMSGGDCDASIAEASAAVTHVQSESQEVGFGDEGLGLLCFDLLSAESDFWWLWRASSRDLAYFRVSCDILRSSRKRSSPCVPTTVVLLKQPTQSIHTSRVA